MTVKSQLALVVSLLALGVSGSGMVAQKAHAAEVNNSDIHMRVGEYNIAAGAGRSDTVGQAQLIKEQNLDMIGLSEVDKNTTRNPFDMVNRFGQFSGMTNTFFGKTYQYDDKGGQYGIGMASKIKLEDPTMNLYPQTPGQSEPWGYERAVVTINGVKVAFYNTHLEYEYTRRKVRDVEMAYLKDVVQKDKTPYKIIVGDFNTDDNKNEWDSWKQDFNLGNGGPDGWQDTFNVYDDTMRNYAIDNVVTSKNININHFNVIKNTTLSDHYPVVADITLKNAVDISGAVTKAKTDGAADEKAGKALNTKYNSNQAVQSAYAKAYNDAKAAATTPTNNSTQPTPAASSSSTTSSSTVSSSSSNSSAAVSSSAATSSSATPASQSSSSINQSSSSTSTSSIDEAKPVTVKQIISIQPVKSKKSHLLKPGTVLYRNAKLSKHADQVKKVGHQKWRLLKKEVIKIKGKKHIYYQLTNHQGIKVWAKRAAIKK